jgi:hypothetical protein
VKILLDNCGATPNEGAIPFTKVMRAACRVPNFSSFNYIDNIVIVAPEVVKVGGKWTGE